MTDFWKTVIIHWVNGIDPKESERGAALTKIVGRNTTTIPDNRYDESYVDDDDDE